MSPCSAKKCRVVLALVASFAAPAAVAQTYLIADGVSDTYALINSVLGGTAMETPDCAHPDFGRHITQELDGDLGRYAFVFHIHVTPDNDRCVAFDRQRDEIKTYGPSPAYLKGFYGDTVTLRWKFMLDAAFQSSPAFTHIHQIKAGDGDDAAPIMTITARAGSPERLQLIHVSSAGITTTVATADLSAFKGAWVDAYEKITYGFDGTYSLTLTNVSNGSVLFFYRSDDIDLWRNGTTFVRPKWGIYRSLTRPEYLRNEDVAFDDFCLAKGTDDCP